MTAQSKGGPIRIGIVSDEPIRVAGIASAFEQPALAGKPQLVPVAGTVAELVSGDPLEYVVIDLHSANGVQAMETIRHMGPEIRLIVIGPQGDDELVMSSIVAGARAYLDPDAGPEVVRQAIEIVTSGSIWAPRRILSKLIDRLLRFPDSNAAAMPQLTDREQQVLELILGAQSNREIASHLGIEERTVKAYVGRLMRKTGADNRVKLSLLALHQSRISKKQGGVENDEAR
ncbi:MAG: LuxR C-terminal-related transcriptional regulator [Acidobacteriota bacterium]